MTELQWLQIDDLILLVAVVICIVVVMRNHRVRGEAIKKTNERLNKIEVEVNVVMERLMKFITGQDSRS